MVCTIGIEIDIGIDIWAAAKKGSSEASRRDDMTRGEYPGMCPTIKNTGRKRGASRLRSNHPSESIKLC